MGVVQQGSESHFALRLEQGAGRLVLSERRIADLFVIEEMQLGLRDVPHRLDTSGGIERFRHQRSRLEKLSVYVEDHELSRVVRGHDHGQPVLDLELWALDGDLVLAGEVEGEPRTPFIARARIESAGIGEERALLVSVYEVRTYGASELAPPQVAGSVLRALGLGEFLAGPTVAVVDPIQGLLTEACAELGWKLPERKTLRLSEVRSEGGRLYLTGSTETRKRGGPRDVTGRVPDSARTRRFLTDYEAKTLYASTESLIEAGSLTRAITTYERQLELNPDHPFLINRLLQLQSTRVENHADALSLARSRLARYPDDLDALAALATVHCRQEQYRKAAEILVRIAELAESRGDPVEAAQARCGVARMLADSDPEAAVSALESALALRRRLPGALRSLADLQARAGDWVAALKTRERLLATEEDPRARRSILLDLGRSAISEANDLEGAMTYFERVLDEWPEEVGALVGLAEAQDKAGHLLPALRTLDRAARILQQRGDSIGAAEVMVQLGNLWRREPDDGLSTASLRFRQALMLAPGHVGALFGLAEIAVTEGDPMRARGFLEELLRNEGRSRTAVDRAEIYLKLGEVLQGPGGDSALAISYFQKALDGSGVHAMRALAALETIHHEAGRWDDVARIVELGASRAESPEEKAELLLRLADIVAEKHQDHTRAVQILEEARSHRNDDVEILTRLVGYHRQAGRHNALAENLERLAARTDEPEQLASMYTERAGLLRVHLNRSEEAIDAYTLALGCAPDNREALEGLIDIYRERERHGELVSLLGRLAELGDDESAGLSWLERGRILGQVLQRRDDAIVSLEKAVELLPDDTEPLRLLAELYEGDDRLDLALQQYERLHALYERDGYDEAVSPFLCRLAEVSIGLDRLEEGVGYLELARDADPHHLEVYERLQDVYLGSGELDTVVDFIRLGLDQATHPKARAFLATRGGRLLWRELRRPDEAAGLLDEAARHNPEDTDVRRMRLEVATARGDWGTVSELLREQLERAEPAERPALLISLAQLAHHELGRVDEGMQLLEAALTEDSSYVPGLTLLGEWAYEAADWSRARTAYLKLLEAEGDDARTDDIFRLAASELHLGHAESALPRLRELQKDGHVFPGQEGAFFEAYLQVGDADRVASMLNELEGMAGEPDALLALYRRAARLLTRDERHESAAEECWRNLLNIEPGDTEAQEALESLNPAEESVEEPTEDSVGDSVEEPAFDEAPTAAPASRPSVPQVLIPGPLEGLSEIPMDRTADISLAPTAVPLAMPASLTTIDISLDESGPDYSDDDAILEELSQQFSVDDDELPPLVTRTLPTEQELEAPDEAATGLIQKISEASEPAERARLALELAELKRDRLHDPEGAIPHFMLAIEQGQPGGEAWLEAMEAMEDLRALRAEWDELLSLYDRRIDSGVGDAIEIGLVKASVLRTCGRLEEAVTLAEASLPGSERGLELLVVLLSSLGRTDEAADHLVSGLDELSREEAAHRLWRAAELRVEDSPEDALSWMHEASSHIRDPQFLDDFLQLARKIGEAEVLVDALTGVAAQLRADGHMAIRKSGLMLEAGRLAREALEVPEQARIYLDESIKAWPDNMDAVTELAELLKSQEDFAGLAEIWEHEVQLSLPGPYRGELALRLARLVSDELQDLDRARTYAQMACEDLGEGEESGQAKALLASLEDGAPVESGRAEDLAETLVNLSESQFPGAEGMSESIEMLEEALGLDPANHDAYRMLAQLYGRSEDFQAQCGILERHAAVAGAIPERAQLLLKRGQIAADSFKDTAVAADAFERVVADLAADLDTTQTALLAYMDIKSRRVDLEHVRGLLDERIDHAASDGERAGLLMLRADVWQSRLGQTGKARNDLETALKLEPELGQASLSLGRMAMDRGDLETAAIRFGQSLSDGLSVLNDEEVRTLFQGLERVLLSLDRQSELDAHIRNVLSRRPELEAVLSEHGTASS